MIIVEGTKAKVMSGDRDRVGDIVTIKNIQTNGDCEFSYGCDYTTGNINEVNTNPFQIENKGNFTYWAILPDHLSSTDKILLWVNRQLIDTEEAITIHQTLLANAIKDTTTKGLMDVQHETNILNHLLAARQTFRRVEDFITTPAIN